MKAEIRENKSLVEAMVKLETRIRNNSLTVPLNEEDKQKFLDAVATVHGLVAAELEYLLVHEES